MTLVQAQNVTGLFFLILQKRPKIPLIPLLLVNNNFAVSFRGKLIYLMNF